MPRRSKKKYGAQAGKVAEALRPFGYSQDAIDRAVKSLKPKVSHAAQIRKIAEHLGLAPDGDIANAWVTLSRTADQAHKRDFHHSLRIDADFRKEFQKPFELVVRGVMVALEPRFSAMTKRAEALAASAIMKIVTSLKDACAAESAAGVYDETTRHSVVHPLFTDCEQYFFNP